MNRSSIVMAFLLAGFLSAVMHNVAIGPIVFGPDNHVSQTMLYNKNNTLPKHAQNVKHVSVRTVKTPL